MWGRRKHGSVGGERGEGVKYVVQSPRCQGVCYVLLGIFSQVTSQ